MSKPLLYVYERWRLTVLFQRRAPNFSYTKTHAPPTFNGQKLIPKIVLTYGRPEKKSERSPPPPPHPEFKKNYAFAIFVYTA